MGGHIYIPHTQTDLSQQCEASLPANMMSSSCGALCVGTTTLLHIHVCEGGTVSIWADQVYSAIAVACLLTAGARMLHSCCCFRVPE